MTHDVESEQNTLWSNKWTHDAAIAAEELIILDLVKTMAQNVAQDGAGLLNTCTYCKVVWEMLTVDRLKARQCALDGGSTISKIIEIEKKRSFWVHTCEN